MSGGAYNYLCYQTDARGVIDLTDLEAMRDRLRELAPDHPATQATARLYDTLTNHGLADVWRAVEWFDSGDSGRAEVDAALRDYEHEKGQP